MREALDCTCCSTLKKVPENRRFGDSPALLSYKEYENSFGRFTYRDVPPEVYPFGIRIQEESDYVYQIAGPEKALCDKLHTMPPVTSRRELERMLFEDLRIDRAAFAGLDKDDLLQIGGMYHCSNLKYLMKYLRRAA